MTNYSKDQTPYTAVIAQLGQDYAFEKALRLKAEYEVAAISEELKVIKEELSKFKPGTGPYSMSKVMDPKGEANHEVILGEGPDGSVEEHEVILEEE